MELNKENSANFLLEDEQKSFDPWLLFEESKILLGDVYWKSPRGKKILMHRCASLITNEQRSRINNNRNQFEFDLKINEPYYRLIKKLLSQLASRSREISERLELQKESRDELLKNILPCFWFGEEDGELFDIVLAWNEQMNSLPSEIEREMIEKNEDLYKRSMLIGWTLNVYALMLGYSDYFYLKEVYNAVFLMDFSLIQKGLSTLDNDKMENDVLSWDKGLHAIDSLKSVEYLKEKFKYKSVFRMIERHHEDLSGNGPLKINRDESMDLESILGHLNRKFGYGHEPFNQYVAKGILAELVKVEESGHSIKKRTYFFIESAIKAFAVEDNDYLAVGGL